MKRMIYNRLPVERIRPKGSARITGFERHYPYLQNTTPRHSMSEKQEKKRLDRIARLAGWLDNAIPGSPIPLGIDSLLSFIPFVGGFVGTIFALYQVYLSTAFGIPLWLLLRMLINVVIDFCIGMIPVVGGFLDVFYKANLWNYEALQDYLAQEQIRKSTDPASSYTPTPAGTHQVGWIQLITDFCRLTGTATKGSHGD